MANAVQNIINELIKRKEAIDITINTLQAELMQMPMEAPQRRGRRKGTAIRKVGRPRKALKANRAKAKGADSGEK